MQSWPCTWQLVVLVWAKRSAEPPRRSASAHVQRCEAAASGQRAAEDEARSLRHEVERLGADLARLGAEHEAARQAQAAELASAHEVGAAAWLHAGSGA